MADDWETALDNDTPLQVEYTEGKVIEAQAPVEEKKPETAPKPASEATAPAKAQTGGKKKGPQKQGIQTLDPFNMNAADEKKMVERKQRLADAENAKDLFRDAGVVQEGEVTLVELNDFLKYGAQVGGVLSANSEVRPCVVGFVKMLLQTLEQKSQLRAEDFDEIKKIVSQVLIRKQDQEKKQNQQANKNKKGAPKANIGVKHNNINKAVNKLGGDDDDDDENDDYQEQGAGFRREEDDFM